MLGLAGNAAAEPRVASYDPNPAGCGGRVEIRGSDFGDGKNGRSIRYGQTGLMGTLAPVPDRDWNNRSILVTLPTRMGPGSYWLAIYGADGSREGNQLRRLDVTCGGEMAVGGLRATAPTVVNQAHRDDDFAKRQLGASPGQIGSRPGGKAPVANEMALDIKRRAATDVDLGLRVAQAPSQLRMGESFSPLIEVYRRRREGGVQLHLGLASSAGPRLDWKKVKVTVPAAANGRAAPPSVSVTPEMVEDGQLKVVYRLEHPTGQHWLDSDPSNNTLNLSVPVVGSKTYRIDASVEDIRIKGRCDHRSWGEWYFSLYITDKNLWNEDRFNEWLASGFHPPNGTLDLDDGAHVPGRVAASLGGIAYDHVVHAHVGGVECDQGLGTPGDRCAGAEDQVISRGAVDQLFDEFDIQPSEWRRGLTRPIDVGDGRCGWTGRFRLNAREE